MDANASGPSAQPVTEPAQFQSQAQSQYPPKSESTSSLQQQQQQQQQVVASTPNLAAYLAEPDDYRLFIDKDPVSGSFIYKTVSRVTGETVAQFPSEALVRMRDSADYVAGTVFKAKV